MKGVEAVLELLGRVRVRVRLRLKLIPALVTYGGLIVRGLVCWLNVLISRCQCRLGWIRLSFGGLLPMRFSQVSWVFSGFSRQVEISLVSHRSRIGLRQVILKSSIKNLKGIQTLTRLVGMLRLNEIVNEYVDLVNVLSDIL